MKLDEAIFFQDMDKAPQQFKSVIGKIANRVPDIVIDDGTQPISDEDVVVRFGRGSLPSEPNTVVVGNKFYSKIAQYRKLSGKVNTLKTYTDAVELGAENFIAKRNIGQKQQGQMINRIPDNPEDYIYQRLVNIVMEFRVVCYYMNGEYHVSGIYRKTGSNASFSQVSQNDKVGSIAAQMAKQASKALGYGLSGCDIAIVNAADADIELGINESMVGKLSSKLTKIAGNMTDYESFLEDNHMVVLECNSFPSMGNPAIAYDLLQDMQKNRV